MEGNMKIDKNPCMLWNFSNVYIQKDRSFNVMVNKDKSKDSVDGVVALAMALHEWIRTNMAVEYLDIKNINMNDFTK
jgi:phage terminase large subunit-like protein